MIFISARDYFKYAFMCKGVIELREPSEEYNLETVKFATKTHQYHDKLFKQILSNKKEFIHLINTYTDYTKYAPKLKTTEIELYDKEFVTKRFKKTESDLIYKIKDKNLYFILEQQTNIDVKMPVRIAYYCLELIQKASEEEKEYPLICPIVLYTGKRKWNVPKSITEKQKRYYETPIQRYPKYNLIDVHDYSVQELIKDKSVIAKAILFEKIETKEELEKILKLLKERGLTKKEIEYISIMLTYSEHINIKMNKEEIEKYKKLIREGGDSMVTNFERLFVELVNEKHDLRKKAEAEGRAKGEEKGRKEGRKEEIIQIAKNMLKKNVSDEFIIETTSIDKKELEKIKKQTV